MLNLILGKIIAAIEQLYYSIDIATVIYIGIFIVWIIFNRFHRLSYQTPLIIGFGLLFVCMLIFLFSPEAAGVVGVYVFLCIGLTIYQILTDRDKTPSSK